MRLPPRNHRTGRFTRLNRSNRSAGSAPRSTGGIGPASLLVPAALLAVGVFMWRRQSTMAGIDAPYGSFPLAGVDGFGRKLKKGIKKVANSKVAKIVTKIDPVAATIHQVKRTVEDPKRLIKKPAHLLSKLPGGRRLPLVRKLTRGRGAAPSPQPEPGQDVVYQDINGATITKAEYDALGQAMLTGSPVFVNGRWAMPTGVLISDAEYRALAQGGTQTPGFVPAPSAPASSGSGTSYTNIVSPEEPSGGGGGGGQSYDLGPEAPQIAPQQQYADSSADMPAPASSKLNPLIAIGTLLAVPVVLGLTGGK